MATVFSRNIALCRDCLYGVKRSRGARDLTFDLHFVCTKVWQTLWQDCNSCGQNLKGQGKGYVVNMLRTSQLVRKLIVNGYNIIARISYSWEKTKIGNSCWEFAAVIGCFENELLLLGDIVSIEGWETLLSLCTSRIQQLGTCLPSVNCSRSLYTFEAFTGSEVYKARWVSVIPSYWCPSWKTAFVEVLFVHAG
jgi:hypothetical protein